METDGKKRGNMKGRTTEVVSDRVRALRQAQQLDLAGLSARLTDLGWPIPVAALSRLENQNRRVDVDDLVALANALQVPPISLLTPEPPISPMGTTVPDDISAGEFKAWLQGQMKNFASHERNKYWWSQLGGARLSLEKWDRDAEEWAQMAREHPENEGAKQLAAKFSKIAADTRSQIKHASEMIIKYPQERPHIAGYREDELPTDPTEFHLNEEQNG